MPNKWNSSPSFKKTILDWAITYATIYKWFVFPSPASGAKKGIFTAEMTNGNPWGATRDVSQLRSYWRQVPLANIGIVTGPESGIFIVECDTKEAHDHDGIESLKQLESQYAELPETLMAISPSGSIHRIFKYPGDCTIVNSASKLGPGIDVRGDGGMAIGPPSIRKGKDKPYRWINWGTPIAEAPQWLINLASSAPREESTSDDTSEEYGEATIEQLTAAMSVIPNDDLDWESWNRTAMALWAASGGVAFNLFDEWSQKSKKYKKDVTLRKWNAYKKSPPKVLSAGTIFWQADEADSSWRDNVVDAHPEINIDDAINNLDLNKKTKSKPNGKGKGNGHDKAPEPEAEIEQPEPGNEPPIEVPVVEMPAHLLEVPGLVGEIAQFILDTSMYPQPIMALATALEIVGTAAGRYFATPTISGTHLYIVCVADTGSGKNHSINMVSRIFEASGMMEFIGPTEFMSASGVLNFMEKKPLSLCVQDEFGAFLKRINSKYASSHEAGITKIFRTAWGCSFSLLMMPGWADVDKTKAIHWPAMSLLGFSTSEEFFESLQSKDVINGLLNRFLVFESLKRIEKRVPVLGQDAPVPKSIVDKIGEIYDTRGGAMAKISPRPPSKCVLDISQDAEKLWNDFEIEVFNSGEKNVIYRSMMSRMVEMSARLATIITVGLRVDCIEADIMGWAINFVRWSGKRMITLSNENIVDSENMAMVNTLRKEIKNLTANGAIFTTKRNILRVRSIQRYKQRDIIDGLKALSETGEIEIITKSATQKGGRTSQQIKFTKVEEDV